MSPTRGVVTTKNGLLKARRAALPKEGTKIKNFCIDTSSCLLTSSVASLLTQSHSGETVKTLKCEDIAPSAWYPSGNGKDLLDFTVL